MRIKTFQLFLVLLFAVIMLLGSFLYFVATELYFFVAENKPIHGELLVVEGWIPDYALREAFATFQQGSYKYLVTTGLKISDKQPCNGCSSYAQFAKKKLTGFGLDANRIIPVTALNETRSRTFSCAIAFQKWLSAAMPEIKSVDVFTVGGHARKTRIMFQKAIGENVSVGIIAALPRIYDPEHWWASKTGLKLVFRSFVGYLYAVVFTAFMA